jgi:hypothetical protein
MGEKLLETRVSEDELDALPTSIEENQFLSIDQPLVLPGRGGFLCTKVTVFRRNLGIREHGW